jgi:MFS family permease
MAFGNACCLAMVSEALPKERYGTGMGYYSLAQVVSQALGPTVGLWLSGLVGFQMTYGIIACLLLLGIILALQIKTHFKRTKKSGFRSTA